MQSKFQFFLQEMTDRLCKYTELFFVIAQKHEIIRISNIVFFFKVVLHMMIKFIHVNIHQKLRSEVPERQANTPPYRTKTFGNFTDEPQNIFVRNMLG